jgi:hypothetical protein
MVDADTGHRWCCPPGCVVVIVHSAGSLDNAVVSTHTGGSVHLAVATTIATAGAASRIPVGVLLAAERRGRFRQDARSSTVTWSVPWTPAGLAGLCGTPLDNLGLPRPTGRGITQAVGMEP